MKEKSTFFNASEHDNIKSRYKRYLQYDTMWNPNVNKFDLNDFGFI